MPRINLGDKVKDKVTGFTGTVVATTDWIAGCRRIAVQPAKLDAGKPIDPHQFDEEMLEVIKPKAKPKPKKKKRTGGDQPAMRREGF